MAYTHAPPPFHVLPVPLHRAAWSCTVGKQALVAYACTPCAFPPQSPLRVAAYTHGPTPPPHALCLPHFHVQHGSSALLQPDAVGGQVTPRIHERAPCASRLDGAQERGGRYGPELVHILPERRQRPRDPTGRDVLYGERRRH